MQNKQFKLKTSNLNLYDPSLTIENGIEFGIALSAEEKRLIVLGASAAIEKLGFVGSSSAFGNDILLNCPQNHQNAFALRNVFAWLQPKPLGLKTSAGMGDRLGLATAGHVCAVQQAGGSIAPIFAQQSIREMQRTLRSPDQVMDDATWGIFQESWQKGVGADADHLKTSEDIDLCLASGFTFFTIDPSNFVQNQAESSSVAELQERVRSFPKQMQLKESGLLGKSFNLEGIQIVFTEDVLLKAMVKYGLAIWHVKQLYEHLANTAKTPFELEVSVDETDLPTSHAEHFYIASELKRLGVKWVSLAPRYVGRFEKGVDYIGDLAEFDADMQGHAAIARQLGPYKLSLHSGSDKYSIYSSAMSHTQGMVHLKTAGTSYLEALHTIAQVDQELIKEIYAFARQRYETDRKSYHVSAQLSRAALPEDVTAWEALIEQFDAREIFHVTFGSVLTEKKADGTALFYDRLMKDLRNHSDVYKANLTRHFIRHLQPFSV
jgi:hypothetical protein